MLSFGAKMVVLVTFLKSVVPKLVRAVTQIKVAIMSYHPQHFTVIVHNTE